MMKRIIVLVLVFTFLVPAAALAATEFALGGYVKLNMFWDSSQEGHHMNVGINRDNDPNFHHGRMKFTAQETRFNFTIKGPKLWGATTTGYIEIDFDSTETGLVYPGTGATGGTGIAKSASGSYTPRMRHAMFRLDWPETELMMGQYWSMFCEWGPELAQAGALQVTGSPVARLAQIRLTQKFAGGWSVGALVGEPNSALNDRVFGTDTATRGDRVGAESGEMPQIQGKVRYQQDLWGKAAYLGKPIPFTVQVTAGVQRNVFNSTTIKTFGENQFNNVAGATFNNRNLYPWMVMGSMFVPVIPTHSPNLAGTASLLAQWYIGQGVEAFGFTGYGSNFFQFSGIDNLWNQELGKRFGGYVQGQYYFNNQWFLSAAYAMSRAFDVSVGETNPNSPAVGNRVYAVNADTLNLQQEFDLCLWYRPIQALKFGLQYAYVRTDWFQVAGPNPNAVAAGQSNFSQLGDAHRVEFVAYFFF
jgi:hypothetical protein